MKKLNNNTRNQIVQEVANKVYDFWFKKVEEYNKTFNKVLKVMLKSPLCYDIGYSAKYQPEEIKVIIDQCVGKVAHILTKTQVGNSPEQVSWTEVNNELALFETTQDFADCEDAYEVIDCLYNFFVEKYK